MTNSTPAAQCDPGTRGSRRGGYVRIWVVVILGVVISCGAFLLANRAEARRDEERFQRQIAIFSSAFQERRNGIEDVLRTLRALFNQNPQLSHELFHETLRDLAIRTEGLQALVWAPRVSASERDAVERDVRSRELPSFQFTEGDLIHAPAELPQRAGERPEYFPVMFVEPQAGNESAVGYDLGSVPQVRLALDKARDSGSISVSARVSLRYESEVRPSCVIAIPVFHPTFMPATRDERARQVRGYVLAVLIFKTAMQQIRNRIPGVNLDVMIIDKTPGAAEEVLDAPADPLMRNQRMTGAAFKKEATSELRLGIAGRQWSLLFCRGPAWESGSLRWHPYTLLASGLVLTLILARYLLASMRRALEIEKVVVQRTADLAKANVQLQGEIQERVQAQSDLARDRGLLRTLIDRLPDSVFVTDSQRRYLMINQAHCRLLNIRNEEQGLHRPVGEVGPPALARVLESGSAAVIESGTPLLNREEHVPLPEGRIAILLLSKMPLLKAGGGIDGLVVLCRDVTAVRAADMEKQDLARRLQETQKLESLGLLAGGIAHDFNNLLTSVLGNVGLARLELPPDSPALDCLDQIESTGVRAADLCKQMLAYSGKGRFIVRRIDLSALVQDTTELLRLSVSKKAEIVLELAPDRPSVSGDATQLRQILMNLVINASEALGEANGVIRITTGVVHVDRGYLESTVASPDLDPGDYACLEVSDNGCGMGPDTQARIFDPFFTTKFAGRGLGLAAALGIVRGHKGAIKVYSEPGRGSTFKLLLPLVAGPVERDVPQRPPPAEWRGSGVMLVVDDEDAVRAVASRILEKVGFEVDTARDGRDGVDVFAANPQRYSAVLLDLTMPRMDGEEAFRELRRIRPDARVLLMSGFSPQEAIDRFAGRGLDGFLQKPFGAPSLTKAVRELLEQAGARS